jgi:hypothetical protein
MEDFIIWSGAVTAGLFLLCVVIAYRNKSLTWATAIRDLIGSVVLAALLYLATDGGREMMPSPPQMCDDYGQCDR